MNKEKFVNPDAAVVRFAKQDIVTTSEESKKPIGGGGIPLPEDTFEDEE